MTRPTHRAAGLLALMLTMGSTVAFAQLPFMRNMYTGPVVLPQVETRAPVEDTIAVDGDWLRDPVPNTPETRAEGAQMYDVYCAVCHGATGQGDGQIADHFSRMPNLALPYVQDYTDGWIYAIIREGGRSMPPFAHSMSLSERWSLVHYVKTFEVATTP
jgi:mono/diheme cytochrome c family protein